MIKYVEQDELRASDNIFHNQIRNAISGDVTVRSTCLIEVRLRHRVTYIASWFTVVFCHGVELVFYDSFFKASIYLHDLTKHMCAVLSVHVNNFRLIRRGIF